MTELFYWIDIGLYLLGGMFILWYGLRALKRGIRFHGAPGLGRQLTPELVAVPILVYLAAAFAVQAQIGTGASPDTKLSQTVQANANNFVQLLGLAACLWIGHVRTEGGLRKFLFNHGNPSTILFASVKWLLASLSLCALVLFLTERVMQWWWPGRPLERRGTLQALQDESPGCLLRIWLYAGALLIAPLAEECFFRGLVQTFVGNLTGNRGVGIGVAAVLFGLVHVSQPHVVPALIVFAVMLGLAYETTGILLVPIAVHVFFNMRTLVWHALGAMPTGG